MNAPLPTRLFSLREANALVAVLQSEFTRVRTVREELADVQRRLERAGYGVDSPEIAVDPAAPPAVQELQREAARLVDHIRQLIRGVAELGVEVKAADGLVDFRSRLEGRVVYLCWRYGEEGVTHFHELGTGFSGRKLLPAEGDFVGDLLH